MGISAAEKRSISWWRRNPVPWVGKFFDKMVLSESNPAEIRIQKLRDEILEGVDGKIGQVSIHRVILFTESYKQTEGEPAIIRRAKAVDNVFRNIPIPVPAGQLLIGYPSSTINGAEIEPEFHCAWLENTIELNGRKIRELDAFPIRKFIEFGIADEDRNRLDREIIPYWREQTLHNVTVKELVRHNPERD